MGVKVVEKDPFWLVSVVISAFELSGFVKVTVMGAVGIPGASCPLIVSFSFELSCVLSEVALIEVFTVGPSEKQ